ncbi:unnamed protein product [Cylindrotheca closterium]|uniref:HSF-type DNA-binding domain-containing protein n=1 Tax=Cylindrotheca closterium TaxID=2856 RepID=A0AAD2G144_9STRA|nr:unnamed protein product [Cylindrotheca closterium]
MAYPRTFPFRLHAILEHICDTQDVDAEGSIVSWTPTGKSFRIHNLGAFKKCVLPKYFPKQSKYKSFLRQLQYYGFINYGFGHFGHPFFLRQNKALLSQIKHNKASTSVSAAAAEKRKDYLLLPESPTQGGARESLDRFIIEEVTARDDDAQHTVKFNSNALTMLALPRLRHAEVLAQVKLGLASLQNASRSSHLSLVDIQALNHWTVRCGRQELARQVLLSSLTSSPLSLNNMLARRQVDLALLKLGTATTFHRQD